MDTNNDLLETLADNEFTIETLQKTIERIKGSSSKRPSGRRGASPNRSRGLNTMSLLEELNNAHDDTLVQTINQQQETEWQRNSNIQRNLFEDSIQSCRSPSVVTAAPLHPLPQTQPNGINVPRTTIPTCPTAESTNVNNKSSRIFVIGDSIGKSIEKMLGDKCPSHSKVVNFTQGGIGIKQANNIFVNQQVSANDFAVIIIGTNDLFKTSWSDMKSAFLSLLEKLKSCKKIYLVQITKRYDIPKANKHIVKLNTSIKYLVNSFKNVNVINSKCITYHHLSDDKLHLNTSGKRILVHTILTTVFPQQNTDNQQTKSVYTRPPRNERSVSNTKSSSDSRNTHTHDQHKRGSTNHTGYTHHRHHNAPRHNQYTSSNSFTNRTHKNHYTPRYQQSYSQSYQPKHYTHDYNDYNLYDYEYYRYLQYCATAYLADPAHSYHSF